MENIIEVHPDSKEQEKELKSYLKKSKMKFTLKKGSSYDPEFVAKIEQSRLDLAEGKGRIITIDELTSLCK